MTLLLELTICNDTLSYIHDGNEESLKNESNSKVQIDLFIALSAISNIEKDVKNKRGQTRRQSEEPE